MNYKVIKSNFESKKVSSTPHLQVAFISIIFLLASCAANLAPKFSQAIVDNISTLSTDIFQLFASVPDGASKDDFSSRREEKYDALIGRIDALDFQIKARPIPNSKIRDKVIKRVNEGLAKRGRTLLNVNDSSPSASALLQIRKNIEAMKKADMDNGLTKTEVESFKGNIVLFLDQAITYEGFLNK